MGVEYILTRRLFDTLPAEEKKLWHSHVYEVKSGSLIAPGIPVAAEKELMEQVVGTYGKTWHTWPTDQQRVLPTGHPMLMMGFIADGQLRPEFLADRDKRFNISTAEKKRKRESIPDPGVAPEADAWTKGQVLQLNIGPAQPGAYH